MPLTRENRHDLVSLGGRLFFRPNSSTNASGDGDSSLYGLNENCDSVTTVTQRETK